MEREWFVNKGRGRSKGHWCWENWRSLSSPGLFRCTVHQHCSPALMLTVYVYVYVKQNNIGFQVWYHKRERIFNLSFFLEVHICKNSAIKVTLPPLHLPLAAESIHRGCKDVYHFFFFSFFLTICCALKHCWYHETWLFRHHWLPPHRCGCARQQMVF